MACGSEGVEVGAMVRGEAGGKQTRAIGEPALGHLADHSRTSSSPGAARWARRSDPAAAGLRATGSGKSWRVDPGGNGGSAGSGCVRSTIAGPGGGQRGALIIYHTKHRPSHNGFERN